MRPEPVSAIVRDEMTIEVSSPTLGTHVLLIDELIEIMEKATEAVERFETPSRKVLDQTEKPMSKQTKNAVPTTKPALTYRGIIFGGEEKLYRALTELIERHKPKAAFVYSTCIVGII